MGTRIIVLFLYATVSDWLTDCWHCRASLVMVPFPLLWLWFEQCTTVFKGRIHSFFSRRCWCWRCCRCRSFTANQPTKRANDNNNWCVHWHSILEGQQPNTNIFTGSPFIHRLHQNCYYSFVLGGGTGIVVRWANMTVLLAPRLIRPCMHVWVYLSPGHTDYWTLGRAQVGLLVIGFWFMFIPCACRALYTLT